MNRNQRIILALGAAALIAVLFTTPSYVHGPNGVLWKPTSTSLPAVWDYRSAITKSIIVSAATACLCFAAGRERV